MVRCWRLFPGASELSLALILLGTALTASAAAEAAPQPTCTPYMVWQMEDGWHQSTVTAIVQTREGYLWLATYTGLVRFDGVRYTIFDSSNTAGLQNSRITSLHEDEAGVLWIGHETGELTRLRHGHFEAQPLGPNWKGGVILGISTDRAGDTWVLSETGQMVRVRDGRAAQAPGQASSTQRPVLTRCPGGALAVTTGGLLSEQRQGELVQFSLDPNSPETYVQAIAPARDGSLWVIRNARLQKWSEGKWLEDLGPTPSGDTTPTTFLQTRSGQLLIGTIDEGLFLLTPGREVLHFSRTNGLSHNWVRSVAEDHEGNLWIGTGSGLDTLRRRKVEMIGAPDGFGGSAVMSFAVTAGGVWAGTEGSGLYHWDHKSWRSFTETSGISNRFIWSVLQSRSGDLLAGTWGAGLLALGPDHTFQLRDGFAQLTAPVVCLFGDRDGDLWVGTTVGLHRFRQDKLIWSATKKDLAFPDVRSIAQGADGAIWFGMSGGGLGVLRDGQLDQIRRKDGLSSDFIQALYFDTDGSLWIGTSDNGLTRLKGGKFSHVGGAQGLPVSVICHIVDDGKGCLWFSSNRGIFRATKADLHRVADRQAGTIQFVSYGKSEGLLSLNCSGGFQPGACRGPDGRLWFPTSGGLAVINPEEVTTNPVPPPVVIEALVLDGEPAPALRASDSFHSPAPAIDIPPGKQRFELRFTGLSFAAPEKVRFKYRLAPLEGDWMDADTERVVQYNYLEPGEYTFRVAACNNDGIWNPSFASLTFRVLPHFWQTWWFQSLTLVGGAACVGMGVLGVTRRRVRHKLEQVERQRALERERARIARDIHDDLGASLTRITMLSQGIRAELDNQPEAASDVDQIYNTARELTRAMDEIVWAVNPKHDTLDSLVTYLGRFAQTFLNAAGLRCRLEVPLNLPAWPLTSEVRHNMFLAFKEALHNVVRHARATEVRLGLELHERGFALLVLDNGCGFDLAPIREARAGSHDGLHLAGGNGLSNMRKRLEQVGGHCEWQTHPGEGTRVRLAIKLNES